MDEAAAGEDLYRREAMAAFAHDIRTPLTSMRMVLELGRQLSSGEGMQLDGELAGMLNQSVEDLQQLIDDLHETSRLERRKMVFSRGPCELSVVLSAARELLPAGLVLDGRIDGEYSGPWDPPHLIRSICGFTDAANRGGAGTGVVRLEGEAGPAGVRLGFTSGTPGGAPRAVAGDCGFAFFRSRLFVEAMGGAVNEERAERYFRIELQLPPA